MDHMYNNTESFLIAYHDKLGSNKKQAWQANFERDILQEATVAKNAEIQSAIDRVEAAERDKQDVDDATIALSEEEQAEVDENYEPVRSRSFTFEVPADKLKDGEGKVRLCCKTRYNCCVICDLILYKHHR